MLINKYTITLFALLLNSVLCEAYDFKFKGICYNICGNSAVVTYPNSLEPNEVNPSLYKGKINIPSSVNINGTEYTVRSVGEKAFSYSNVEDVCLPNTIDSIKDESFAYCKKITEINFPKSLLYIGARAFEHTTSLNTVLFEDSLSEIADMAFYGSSLKEIFLNTPTPPQIVENTFSSKLSLYVKANKIECYQNSVWKQSANIYMNKDATYNYADFKEFVNSLKNRSYGEGIKPGQYSPTSIEMFKKKIDSMDTVTEFSSLREIQLTIESLYDSQPVRNEITPGYYRIVSAGKGQYDNKTFDYEYKFAWFNKNNTVCWKKYDPYDVGMIYKLINQGNGWILLNLRDSTYVVNGKINNEVSASDTFEVQNFTLLQDGKYIIQASTSNQCYSLCKNFCGPSEDQGRLMTFGTLEDNEDKAFNVWFLEPVQDEFVTYLSNEFSKQNLQYVLKKYGKLPSNIKEGIDPGFSKKNSIDTYKNALAKLRSLDEDSCDSIKYIAIATLKNAYEQACTINPIKTGFYNVVTAGNGTGYSGGPYNYENKSAIYNQGKFVKWGPFSQSNYGSIYLFSKADNYSWHLYSVVDHSYINKGSKSYSTQISTSVDIETSQTFKYIKDGKFSFNFSGNPYVYSVAPSHNGSTNENGTLNIWGTPEEAEKYGVNLWYIKSVPDSVISEFYKTAEGLLAKCLYYEDLANDLKIGQNPGYYIEQNVLALKSFLSETKEKLKKGVSDTERILIKEEMDKLYNNALKTNPICEGYYYIVNNNKAYVRTYKNNVSLYTVPYYFVYNNSVACMYNTLDKTNANYVYKISLNNDSTYTIQNAYTSMFLAPELNDSETTGVLCCSNIVRSCNFVVNSVGEFYITDTKKSLNICLPDSIEKYGFVLNNRKLDNCFISNNYTWSLVPVNKEDVDKIISRQKAIDEEKDVAFVEMVSFVDSINITYSEIINETTKYDIEALAILKSKMSVVKKYIASH